MKVSQAAYTFSHSNGFVLDPSLQTVVSNLKGQQYTIQFIHPTKNSKGGYSAHALKNPDVQLQISTPFKSVFTYSLKESPTDVIDRMAFELLIDQLVNKDRFMFPIHRVTNKMVEVTFSEGNREWIALDLSCYYSQENGLNLGKVNRVLAKALGMQEPIITERAPSPVNES